jgi:hypothetical protein
VVSVYDPTEAVRRLLFNVLAMVVEVAELIGVGRAIVYHAIEPRRLEPGQRTAHEVHLLRMPVGPPQQLLSPLSESTGRV